MIRVKKFAFHEKFHQLTLKNTVIFLKIIIHVSKIHGLAETVLNKSI